MMKAPKTTHPSGEYTDVNLNRDELIRVVLQTLDDLGLHESSKALRDESSIELESFHAMKLKEAIMQGDFEVAIEVLEAMSEDLDGEARRLVRFMIFRERYLELLEAKQIKDALNVLRTKVTPNSIDESQVSQLTMLIMTPDVRHMRDTIGWEGSSERSRKQLLEQLQLHVPSSKMMPSDRLLVLAKQARAYQISQCKGHYSNDEQWSLLRDHKCPLETHKYCCVKELKGHDNEVWHVAFSPDGEMLASGSRDGTCIVWNVSDGIPIATFTDQEGPVTHVSWSPDGAYLVVCSIDGRGRIYDVSRRELLVELETDGEIGAAAWIAEDQVILVASDDGRLTLFSKEGWRLRERSMNVRDLVPTEKGLLAVDYDRNLHEITIDNLEIKVKKLLVENHAVTSLAVGRDTNNVLLNGLGSTGIKFWNIQPGNIQPLKTFRCHSKGDYVIRSCFGRPDDSIIVSGGDDQAIYVWHRDSGNLLQVLRGHSGGVGCVTWHPSLNSPAGIIASASDDATIRLWMATNEVSSPAQPINGHI